MSKRAKPKQSPVKGPASQCSLPFPEPLVSTSPRVKMSSKQRERDIPATSAPSPATSGLLRRTATRPWTERDPAHRRDGGNPAATFAALPAGRARAGSPQAASAFNNVGQRRWSARRRRRHRAHRVGPQAGGHKEVGQARDRTGVGLLRHPAHGAAVGGHRPGQDHRGGGAPRERLLGEPHPEAPRPVWRRGHRESFPDIQPWPRRGAEAQPNPGLPGHGTTGPCPGRSSPGRRERWHCAQSEHGPNRHPVACPAQRVSAAPLHASPGCRLTEHPHGPTTPGLTTSAVHPDGNRDALTDGPNRSPIRRGNQRDSLLGTRSPSCSRSRLCRRSCRATSWRPLTADTLAARASMNPQVVQEATLDDGAVRPRPVNMGRRAATLLGPPAQVRPPLYDPTPIPQALGAHAGERHLGPDLRHQGSALDGPNLHANAAGLLIPMDWSMPPPQVPSASLPVPGPAAAPPGIALASSAGAWSPSARTSNAAEVPPRMTSSGGAPDAGP